MMITGLKREKRDNKIVVAVKESKDISKNALVWALTHVVHPGDCVYLLVVMPSQSSGKKLWGFPRFAGDCASSHRRMHFGTILEQKCDIKDLCCRMMVQLHDVYDPNKINIKVQVVSGSPCGAVAAESKRVHANWVVLDRQLKSEEKRCLEDLQCNIVVMKRSQPKILRLNLIGSPEAETHLDECIGKQPINTKDCTSNSIQGPSVTPTSSPEIDTTFTTTEAGTSSVSSSELTVSPLSIHETKTTLNKTPKTNARRRSSNAPSSDSETDSLNLSWSKNFVDISNRVNDNARISSVKALGDKFSKLDREAGINHRAISLDSEFSGNMRDRVSLPRNAPLSAPPLCSLCQHKAPIFGKPPKVFSYKELELATGGFSKANFLAEGGFGSVHRGILRDGQAIAVKQHKLASSQGDHEFCSEVEVLSCAQHRNVVMLIGFCVEDKRRLLVYEFICNGSLDSHLYGRKREPLEWWARQKVAVGAARGLRYLHEECRVGCIVHRDMRPNNILITHDFESLVGDFGLARWQPDGDLGVETRVIGTFGYLAPEYAQSGQITEKADVYSFGVVLVELVTGRKAVDISRPKGQQCLTEWARPLLEDSVIDQLIDPQLGNNFAEHELCCMLHAASLCIRRDPLHRPKMSQVLRILEGDMLVESNYMSTPGIDPGNRSGRHSVPVAMQELSYDALKAAWDRESISRSFHR